MTDAIFVCMIINTKISNMKMTEIPIIYNTVYNKTLFYWS